MIQITLNEGRTVDLKKVLYKAIAEGLQRAGADFLFHPAATLARVTCVIQS